MNCTYSKLSPTFSQELWELLDEAETLGIDPKVLEALFIAPLISNHIAEAETVAGQRLDTLRTAIEKNTTKMMRLLSRLSFCNTCFVSVTPANRGRKRDIGWRYMVMIHCWVTLNKVNSQMLSTFGVHCIRLTAKRMA